MTLQTSGAISLAEIQTEFGGANPISMSEYYAGGAYVPSGTSGTNGAVPTSGQISFSQFYGTTAVVISITNQTIDNTASDPNSSVAGYELSANGKVMSLTTNLSGATVRSELETWVTPTSAASGYEARASGLSGGSVSGTFNTWLALSTTRTWSLITSGFGNSDFASFTIEIRKTGDTAILDSATVSLSTNVI